MIKTTLEEIRNLEVIGSGKFGTVYKKDDKTAYKIYHTTITSAGRAIDNPALTLPLYRYKWLIARSKKLVFSRGIFDIIFINGDFSGVSIPFYEGETLNKKMDLPLKKKLDLAKKMIRNAKELNSYLIFPTDYKLNNMIYQNDEVKLIDLDDNRTHVTLFPDVLNRSFGVNALAETIETFFKEQYHLDIPLGVYKKIEREKAFNAVRYQRIEDYIKRKEKEKKIILSKNIDELKKLKETILNNDFKIVYMVESKDDKRVFFEIIDKIESENLKLFDFITPDMIDDYYNLENISETFTISDNGLQRIYKK